MSPKLRPYISAKQEQHEEGRARLRRDVAEIAKKVTTPGRSRCRYVLHPVTGRWVEVR